jgi:hypothetical protein
MPETFGPMRDDALELVAAYDERTLRCCEDKAIRFSRRTVSGLAVELMAWRIAARSLLKAADDGEGVASWSPRWDALRTLLPEHKAPPA